MTNYTRGRFKEYELIKQLKAEGFTCLRMAGSKGDWDVISYKNNTPAIYWQVKFTKTGKITNGEFTRFEICPLPQNSEGRMVIFKWGDSSPTVHSRKSLS